MKVHVFPPPFTGEVPAQRAVGGECESPLRLPRLNAGVATSPVNGGENRASP